MIPVPTAAHNEALPGDTLYSAFLSYQWRQIVIPFIVRGMEDIAAAIEDESERQDFEVLYGAMIDDFYNEDSMDGTAVGAIAFSFRTVVPFKWLLCDGTTYPASAYPVLWDALPDDMKTETEFTLPDLRGKFLYGTGTTSEINDTGGAATHTLTESEIPAHTHDVLRQGVSGGSTHAIVIVTNSVAPNPATQKVGNAALSTGGGAAHNNMPPYTKALPIIKALP